MGHDEIQNIMKQVAQDNQKNQKELEVRRSDTFGRVSFFLSFLVVRFYLPLSVYFILIDLNHRLQLFIRKGDDEHSSRGMRPREKM